MNKLLTLSKYVMDGVGYHLTGSVLKEFPRILMFVVTRRCNSRCMMCRSWQEDSRDRELSTTEIKSIFADTFFRKIESVIISGGEPTLRDDLPEIISTIQKSCPRLKHIWTSSNGFNPALLKKRVSAIINTMAIDRVRQLTFNISIDGIGETHDRIRGIKGGYQRSMESIDLLNKIREKHPISVTMNTVIQPDNLNELDEILEVGREKDIPAVLSPLIDDAFFASDNVASNMTFKKNELKQFRDFIARTYHGASDTTSLFWTEFLRILDGKKRRIPCGFDRLALVLGPTGDIRVCTMKDWTHVGNIRDQSAAEAGISEKSKDVRRRLRKEVCPRCPNYCTTDFALEKEFFSYAMYFFRKRIGRVFHH